MGFDSGRLFPHRLKESVLLIGTSKPYTYIYIYIFVLLYEVSTPPDFSFKAERAEQQPLRRQQRFRG